MQECNLFAIVNKIVTVVLQRRRQGVADSKDRELHAAESTDMIIGGK
jgi:hypothetical protein